jgi:hypothetical protein
MDDISSEPADKNLKAFYHWRRALPAVKNEPLDPE